MNPDQARQGSDEGWREHEREQRRAWLALSYRERLLWLEQAKRFYEVARHARKQPVALKTPAS